MSSTDRREQLRRDLIDEMSVRLASIRDQPDDRVGAAWALKMIAEAVRRLDDVDRLEGFLPLQIRAPLMLNSNEASLALHVFRDYSARKGCELSSNTSNLIEKLNAYFDGRYDALQKTSFINSNENT